MKNKTWLGAVEYAARIGKSKQQVYIDIRTGKIPKSRVKKMKKITYVTKILYENNLKESPV